MIAEFAVAFVSSFDNIGKIVVSALAVAGAAFVGGLLIGLAAQLLARMLTAKSMPRPALHFLRVLGGLAAGALVWMLLFGSGGGGGGGEGGGEGSGKGPHKGDGGEPVQAKDKDKDKSIDKNGDSSAKKGTLRVEVLGDPPSTEKRFYRLEGENKLLTLEEVGEAISMQRKQNPELQRVVIVLYKNSPAEDTPVVRQLKHAIEARGLIPGTSLEAARSP